jgi:hypothetical protein
MCTLLKDIQSVFDWAVAFRKAVASCDFGKSCCSKAVVGWIKASLVELLWLLKKSSHFQVGPACHAHI